MNVSSPGKFQQNNPPPGSKPRKAGFSQFLEICPVYLLLLPCFFVFHGYVENYDLIPFRDILLLLGWYLLYATGLFLLFLLLYRKIAKAALAATTCLFFYFFFGAIYDAIWNLAPHSFFSRYSFILGAMAVLLLAIIVVLFVAKRSLKKLQSALNIFLLFLLLVDGAWFLWKSSRHKSHATTQIQTAVCDTCSRPDIFLILTDGYPGDEELSQLLKFDNSSFKNSLRQRGFHCPSTWSNYNYTPFSIGSFFKMDYLANIKRIDTDPGDLSICFGAMREANFFQVLQKHGYTLRNFSLFDIHKQPSPYNESGLPLKTKFITANTLFNRVERNLLYNNTALLKSLQKRRMYISYHNNQKAWNSTLKEARTRSSEPRFVYTHLEMPHYPYYFDRKGNPQKEENLREGKERDTALFKEYLLYTNQKILQLVDSIRANAEKPPVILLVSDHGYRELPFPFPKKMEFNNSVALFLPNGNYEAFYSGITNINLARTFLNTQFKQNLPLKKDSLITVVIR